MTIDDAIDALVMARKTLDQTYTFVFNDDGGFKITTIEQPKRATIDLMEQNGWTYTGKNESATWPIWSFVLGE